jgi:hypothetical protein
MNAGLARVPVAAFARGIGRDGEDWPSRRRPRFLSVASATTSSVSNTSVGGNRQPADAAVFRLTEMS